MHPVDPTGGTRQNPGFSPQSANRLAHAAKPAAGLGRVASLLNHFRFATFQSRLHLYPRSILKVSKDLVDGEGPKTADRDCDEEILANPMNQHASI